MPDKKLLRRITDNLPMPDNPEELMKALWGMMLDMQALLVKWHEEKLILEIEVFGGIVLNIANSQSGNTRVITQSFVKYVKPFDCDIAVFCLFE